MNTSFNKNDKDLNVQMIICILIRFILKGKIFFFLNNFIALFYIVNYCIHVFMSSTLLCNYCAIIIKLQKQQQQIDSI